MEPEPEPEQAPDQTSGLAVIGMHAGAPIIGMRAPTMPEPEPQQQQPHHRMLMPSPPPQPRETAPLDMRIRLAPEPGRTLDSSMGPAQSTLLRLAAEPIDRVPYEPWAVRRARPGFGGDLGAATAIGPGGGALMPETAPSNIQHRRQVLLHDCQGFPWGLLLWATCTLVLLVVVFRYRPVGEFFRDFQILLWTIKFVLVMMLAILLVRFKHRNAVDHRMPLGGYSRYGGYYGGGAAGLGGAGFGSVGTRPMNSEAAILRELQTLSALNQQIGARQQMRDAMQERRRQAVEAREERKRQLKREQASQLVATLPRITIPNSVELDDSGNDSIGDCGGPDSRPTSGTGSRPSSGAGLPNSIVSAEWQRNRPEECCICLGRLDEEECTRLSCGHMYHHTCIESWLVDGTGHTLRCPLCNWVLLDEPEVVNTSEEEDFIEDELDEVAAGHDAALAAEWLLTAAQHAFIMQMARGDLDTATDAGEGGLGGVGGVGGGVRGRNAATDIDEALDAMDRMEGDAMLATESEDDDDDDDDDEENQRGPPVRRNTLQRAAAGGAAGGAADDVDDEIRRFLEEEAEMFVQAEQRLLNVMAAEDELAARDREDLLGRNLGDRGEGRARESFSRDDPLGIDLIAEARAAPMRAGDDDDGGIEDDDSDTEHDVSLGVAGVANADSPRQPDAAFSNPVQTASPLDVAVGALPPSVDGTHFV